MLIASEKCYSAKSENSVSQQMPDRSEWIGWDGKGKDATEWDVGLDACCWFSCTVHGNG